MRCAVHLHFSGREVNQCKQGAIGVLAGKFAKLDTESVQTFDELGCMGIAQYGVGLNLQVKPVWAFVIQSIAIGMQVAGDFGVGNFAQ